MTEIHTPLEASARVAGSIWVATIIVWAFGLEAAGSLALIAIGATWASVAVYVSVLLPPGAP